MDSFFNNLPLEKKDLRTALLWGAVLLVLITLLRGTPITDIYYLLVNVWDFIVNTFVFLEATLDIIAYALILLLLTTLVFAVTSVARALGQRRKGNYC